MLAKLKIDTKLFQNSAWKWEFFLQTTYLGIYLLGISICLPNLFVHIVETTFFCVLYFAGSKNLRIICQHSFSIDFHFCLMRLKTIEIQIFNKSSNFSTAKYCLKKVNKCNKDGR